MEIQIKEIIKKTETLLDQTYKIHLDAMLLKQELSKILDDYKEKKECKKEIL